MSDHRHKYTGDEHLCTCGRVRDEEMYRRSISPRLDEFQRREKRRLYQLRPEVRARRKLYEQSPARRTRSRAYAKRYVRDHLAAPGTSPTPMELRVLATLCDLGNFKLVAFRLGIRDHTARTHATRLYRRLGVSYAVQAVALLDDRNPGWRKRRMAA